MEHYSAKPQRLKILISAHEFSPFQGSECSEGWNLVTRLAKYHDITVIYATGSQFENKSYLQAIKRYFSENNAISGLTLINIDQPRITTLIASFNIHFLKVSSIGIPVFYFLGYKFWQKAVYTYAKRLHRTENFRIAHQLTQITFREPGYLWKLGVPFVWGPTGGTSNIPKDFNKLLSWRSKLAEKIRSFSNYYQFNYVSRIIKANLRASIIYAFSIDDANNLKKRAKGQIKLMIDAGALVRSERSIQRSEDSNFLTAIWCGQLIERKAPEILLKALGLDHFTKAHLRLIIVGSGPLEISLIKLAKDLYITNIEWVRHVNHADIFNLMGTADFFIHTSYREATSNVIPEALSMGLPVICHDANGMSIAINETCGIKIPLKSPEDSIKGFSEAMNNLILDRDLLKKLQSGAINRAKEISWDNMAEIISNDYLYLSASKT
jgi:glycosyltransferase involved in cell wall biosynthesis